MKKKTKKKSKASKRAKGKPKTKAKVAAKSAPKVQIRKAKPKAKVTAKKTSAKSPRAGRPRGRADRAELVDYERKGRGAVSGGQSGAMQGISSAADADSESVAELLEEGQSFEAEVISGVENAPDPDVAEVVTHEVPEDDVPEEYRNQD